MLGYGTNSEEFELFLEKLRTFHENAYDCESAILIMDNHKVHHSKAIQKVFGNFKVLYTPSYSGHLSGVEVLWSLLKAKLNQHLSRIPHDLKHQSFKAEVDWMCSKIDCEVDGRNIFMAARAELLKALEVESEEEEAKEEEEKKKRNV